MSTKDKIEDLLYQNADDFKMAKVLKNDISTYFKTLDETFSTSGGKDFLFKHTRKIDSIIKLIYKIAMHGMFKEYQPLKNSLPITLAALGSYGREQLCVYSDIDLLIIYKDIDGYNTKEMIEKILYLIWDSGLKLGHRVHHIDELLDVSKTDITIKTAILESRFLDGSKYLWTEAQNRLDDIRFDNPKEYIVSKLEEQRLLHKKFPLSMEANLKEGEGGFRDANLVYWLGKIKYNITRIGDLPEHIVNDTDYKNFRISLEFLFRVRSALHLVAGKKEDKLRLDLIPEVAKYLGYNNTREAHMIFAKKVLTNLRVVQLYSLIWIDILSQEYNIQITTSMHQLGASEKDDTLLEIIKYLNREATQKYQASPSLLHQIIQAPRTEKLNKKYYKEIRLIFQTDNAHSTLLTLSTAHLLGYSIPILKKVVNLPQFDGYHRFSVHSHLLECLYWLENIKDDFVKELFDKLTPEDRELLKLVTFLHDGGKGRKKDHSSVGATIFRVYGKNIGLNSKLIEDGALLVQYHTLMSNTAQREDLYNEKTIFKFVAHFKTQRMLDMIYILTYADMNGVGEDIYSTFTSRLLKTLYIQSINTLEHNEMIDETAKRIKKENTLKRSTEFNTLLKSRQKKILSISSNLMFLRYKPEEIINIATKAILLNDYEFKITSENFLTIEIIKEKDLNLGYLLAKLSRLNIVNMDICKLFDGKKYFKIDFGESVDEGEITFIENYIKESFDLSRKAKLPIISIDKKNIDIECNHSQNYAKMLLKIDDTRGLLAYIMTLFDTIGVDIASAKIHTQKKRVQDLFLIEKNGNFCHNVDMILEKMGVK
ncbi:Possible nucleotidyltransferase [hydrothermal vent metagenome]|uniref:Possible nucleotidyltransferase n=1 Tax=hydrothermal vent metagenome TaxID=652676 RepID=A0A1W1BPU8_9ZZZZ